MTTYVEVSVNVPGVAGVFHYHLPPGLDGQCGPGHLVEVPFGRQRVQGVVFRFVSVPEVAETRPVIRMLDPQPALTPAQIELAGKLSEATLAPLPACVDLMLPPGLWQQTDTLFMLNDRAAYADRLPPNELGETQNRLLNLLKKRGPLRGRQIDQAVSLVDWRPGARALVRRGLLSAQSVLPPPTVRPKSVHTVQLACRPEQVAADELGRKGSEAQIRRQKMLRFLAREPGPVDVAWVYAESSGKLGDLHYLAERGLVTLSESEVWRDPLAQVDVIPVEPPMLTHDQQVAWLNIQANIQAACTGRAISPILLHGVTGSGKTEIYLRAVGEILELGKQAIVLVPEIALTPQTVRRFASRFPGRLGLAHSGLSAGERYDTWRRARAGLISIVVGPRSALFTPFHNLGLIIVDEFHDDSYYQSENDPHYHARQAAILYARLSGATCLLGSATPDVASRYLAERGRWQYLNLPMRILAHRQVVQAQVARLGLKSRYRLLDADAETMDLPPVHIVDMRQELKEGNRSIFSRALKSALEETVARNHQAILFINRRGKATYVFCRDCGCVLKCPRCGLPLTYHVHAAKEPASVENTEVLICHYCNYRRKPPQRCPQCGNDRIRYYGMGTERVEDEVRSLLPEVRILRWDYETTRKKGTHEIILSHFVNHRADILVGTQMIAKGLDLPLVTLVGGVLADVGLNLPDYRASERTFQVLTQVAGRAGRSPLGGQVILQTFMPEHYVIQAASQHDYRAFYQRELEYRRDLKYPPFTRLVRLEYRHPLADQAELAARKQASRVRAWLAAKDHRATEMIGPVPCFFNRIGGKYRWQIVLRGPDPVSILRGRDLGDWKVEVDPTSLL